MNRIQCFGVIGILFYCCFCVYATLNIKEIVGREFIEYGWLDDLILDCDFEAEGEEGVVIKWYYNEIATPIYQWIAGANSSYAMDPFTDSIDTKYKVSDDPKTMFRALRIFEVTPAQSGNYTCKVSSDTSEQIMTKQVVVFSPEQSFDIAFNETEDQLEGNEVVTCNVVEVTPKPIVDLYITDTNGSRMKMPEAFIEEREEPRDENGYYNVSITLHFNSSYLQEGITKFVCELSIPGTNHTDSQILEYEVETDSYTQSTELLHEGDYFSLSSTFPPNSTEETSQKDNGNARLRSPLLTILILFISLLVAT